MDPDLNQSDQPDLADVWDVDADGTNRMNLTAGSFGNYQPVWSPDGTVYFVSNRSGIDNVWAVDTGRDLGSARPQTGRMGGADDPGHRRAPGSGADDGDAWCASHGGGTGYAGCGPIVLIRRR